MALQINRILRVPGIRNSAQESQAVFLEESRSALVPEKDDALHELIQFRRSWPGRFHFPGANLVSRAVSRTLRVFCALMIATCPLVPAQTGFQEGAVKAVFLYNFAQFVDWPPEAFSGPTSPMVIGVLGDDPFGPLLDETVNREVVKRHELVVQRYRRVEEIRTCHILFISRSEAKSLEDILVKLNGRAILTVGDSDEFALRGGMIRFLTAGNRVRMRINLKATKAAGLTVSSNLLRAAEIVGGS